MEAVTFFLAHLKDQTNAMSTRYLYTNITKELLKELTKVQHVKKLQRYNLT